MEVAVVIGGADWQPERLDWREFLAELLGTIPAGRRTPGAVATALRRSDELVALSIANSWFADDQEVARMV